MARNTDNEVGTDMNDFPDNLLRRLPLGRSESSWPAIANEKSILETAHILQSLGDLDVEVGVREAEAEERKRKLKRVPVKEYFSSSLKKVFETVDIVLDWLERSTKNDEKMEKKSHDTIQPRSVGDKTDGKPNYNADGKQPNTDEFQKKEGLLRGLYYITELGSYLALVDLLERVSKSLDLPANGYKAKRDHIKECLKEVEKEKQKLSELVKIACDIMQEITRDDQFDHNKADAFNSTVRQANVIIELCKELLSDAEETIDELRKIMSTMKIFSRLIRFAGLGVTWYALYNRSSSSSALDSLATYISAAFPPVMGLVDLKYLGIAAYSAAGYAWLYLFPSRVYAFRDDLEKLKLEHKRLTHALRGLEKRLKAATEDVHKKSKQ